MRSFPFFPYSFLLCFLKRKKWFMGWTSPGHDFMPSSRIRKLVITVCPSPFRTTNENLSVIQWISKVITASSKSTPVWRESSGNLSQTSQSPLAPLSGLISTDAQNKKHLSWQPSKALKHPGCLLGSGKDAAWIGLLMRVWYSGV